MDDVLQLVNMLVSGGGSPEYAWGEAQKSYPADSVAAARTWVAKRQTEIRELPEPLVVQDPDVIEPWYLGPVQGHVIWPATRDAILSDGFPESAMVEDVDPTSTRILNHIPPPGQTSISGRGLVLGYVQSGKTTSYTSLVAKAADAGYRLVIVLAGIHDSLRTQTQGRLDRHLVDASSPSSQWINLTHDGDFSNPPPMAGILSPPGSRALAVVKKNPHRLRRLVSWLNRAPGVLLESRPILVIDDEADQASVNVGTGRRSTINGLILKLLDRPKAAYVAYTATPFANVLIDQDVRDLYPRDFIVALPQPQGYFGPEALFGRHTLTEDEDSADLDGLGVVEQVPDEDAAALRPPRAKDQRSSWSASVPPSLRNAVVWFALATAARRARRQTGHSTMLIHTTMYTEAHDKLAESVESLLSELRLQWADNPSEAKAQYQDVWDRVYRPDLSTRLSLEPLIFDQVLGPLGDVLREVAVAVDNYRSERRLAYPGDRAACVVAIGGNTLSRGLTLHGLVVSYFVRSASAYDTLMQMGRWFGFRHDYADLPRIWMTPDLEDYFIRLATVEAEIRADIARYRLQNKTPLDLAVRIQKSPGLAVTNRAKMRHGQTVHVSYAGQRLQTILFNHRDEAELDANIDAARRLITDAAASGARFRRRDGKPGWWLARDVPWMHVRQFLSSYRFHRDAVDQNADAMIRFVEKQTERGGITAWNVVIAGYPDDRNGTLLLGLPEPANLIVRSRRRIEGLPHANIQSLMSTEDRLADLPDRDDELKAILNAPAGPRGEREGRVAALRPEGIGLVVVYPIQAKSRPRSEGGRRTDLDALDNVIGVGIVFPPCTGTDHEAVEYVVAFQETDDIEDADELAEEEAQLADAADLETMNREDAEAQANGDSDA